MAGAMVTTNVLQTLVAMGLNALRERVVLAKVVNRDYQDLIVGMRKGATVNVAVPAAVAVRNVAPDVVPPAVPAVTPTNVPITLSEWKEAPFAMDDKGVAQVQRGMIPAQATEAIKSVANAIDGFLWGLAHGAGGFYGFAGVAGTTPFGAGISDYTDARQQADAQLMPQDPEDCFVILDSFAKANALNYGPITNAAWRGDADAFRRGEIGQVLGAQWDMSQNVPVHTSGTAAGATTNTAGYAVGVKTVTLASAGTGTILVGDIITFAGDAQPYVVTAGDADVSNGGTVSFEPGLKIALPTSAIAITVKASHRVNLLIHKQAISFAMAPLLEGAEVAGVPVAQAVAIDENSGLSLRLEVTRQHRQYQWAFDALYGASVIRREYGVRIAG